MKNATETRSFKVVDGSYTSEVFGTLGEARKDAQVCVEDENCSGLVLILDAETGKQVEEFYCADPILR